MTRKTAPRLRPHEIGDGWDRFRLDPIPGTNGYRTMWEDPPPTFWERWGNTIEAVIFGLSILLAILALVNVWGDLVGGFVTITVTVPPHHLTSPTALPSAPVH